MSKLEVVAQLATQEPAQARHVALHALLVQLQTWLAANVTTRFAPTAIERMRIAANRVASNDPYMLHMALGSGVGRVLFVPRGTADPCAIVDAVGPNGMLFSIQRIGALWSLVSTTGQTTKLDEAPFVNVLAAQLGRLLQGAA